MLCFLFLRSHHSILTNFCRLFALLHLRIPARATHLSLSLRLPFPPQLPPLWRVSRRSRRPSENGQTPFMSQAPLPHLRLPPLLSLRLLCLLVFHLTYICYLNCWILLRIRELAPFIFHGQLCRFFRGHIILLLFCFSCSLVWLALLCSALFCFVLFCFVLFCFVLFCFVFLMICIFPHPAVFLFSCSLSLLSSSLLTLVSATTSFSASFFLLAPILSLHASSFSSSASFLSAVRSLACFLPSRKTHGWH